MIRVVIRMIRMMAMMKGNKRWPMKAKKTSTSFVYSTFTFFSSFMSSVFDPLYSTQKVHWDSSSSSSSSFTIQTTLNDEKMAVKCDWLMRKQTQPFVGVSSFLDLLYYSNRLIMMSIVLTWHYEWIMQNDPKSLNNKVQKFQKNLNNFLIRSKF